MQQFLLLCGVILGPFFIIVILVEGALRKGYFPMRQPASALSIGPRGWIQQANFLSTAALMLLYAFGLHVALHGLLGSIVLPVLVGIIGLGLAGAGIFVTDVTGLPEDRPKLAQRTKSGVLHDLFSLPVFALLFIAPFIYAYLSVKAGHGGFALYSVLSALVLAPSFVLAGVGFSGVPKFASFGGLFQRISICAGFMWLSIVAGSVIYQHATPHDSAGSDRYTAAILACYPKSPTGAADQPIPNNSIQQVKETSRIFINMPKDLYPQDLRDSWTTVTGNATAGSVNEPGFGEAEGALPGCWSSYVDFEGSGEVDLRVKSVVEGTPDYFVRFIVSPV